LRVSARGVREAVVSMAMMLASPRGAVDPSKMGDQEDSESSSRRMR
jgi:hypothetical protein